VDDSDAEEWAQRLADLERPGREVAQALMSGADAASCSVLEQDGEFGSILRVGDEATATIKFRLPGDAEPRVRVWPLSWALLVAAQSATVDEVSAPDLEGLTWTAAAKVITEQKLPAGLILPQSMRRRRLWLLVARDDRGLSGALHSQDSSLSRWGRLGDVLAAQVARTTVEGAAGRLAEAKRLLGDADSFRSVIAGAVAEYFATPAALTGADGGPALVAYEITTFDPVIRSWQTVASFPPEPVGALPRKRRGALSGRALRALEVEVFGAGFDSARGTTTVISLDTPVTTDGLADNPPTLGDSLVSTDDTARTVEQRLELGELAARAGLSGREREVLHLLLQDQSEASIAATLGIARNTVNTLSLRSRKKLAEAREKSREGV
jgi:DNA-binding CsgD family transcriptional regulator